MKNIWLLFVLLLTMPALADNSGKEKNRNRTITGKITDSSGESIAGVTINIRETGQTFYSDLDGNFKVTLPSGENLHIKVSTVGFETTELDSGKLSAFTDISLEPLN